MANQKITHYNLDPIDAEGSRINIIYGERSNGKSYQVKHKKGVLKYLETGKRFILMRRWKEEISTEKIEQYFSDVDVFKITNGMYNCISMFKKQLWLSNYDLEEGKTKRGEKIGYVVALSTEQNYAGASYLDVEDIIFEEFMSRSEYLSQESDKLMNFLSTVDRKRNVVRLWLVGNTISRVCPYLVDWELLKIVKTQKQGTIENVYLPTGTIDERTGLEYKVKLSIEYCKNSGATSFAIGRHKEMLNKGAWQSDPQPHLPKSLKNYKKLMNILFFYQGFKYIGELLMDKETSEIAWFIYPYNGQIKDKQIVFSDRIRISNYWQRNIYDTTFRNDKLNKLLYNTFRESKIFYATDLCGTDFKQVIDFTIKK